MTKTESRVLALLSDDARYGAEKIATMLGISKQEVEAAIGSLEKSGIIVKYTAVVNREKIGDDYVDALIEVKVTPQQSRGFDAIAEQLKGFPEVQSLYLMSGAYDLAVTVEGRTLKEVANFVSERLSTLPSVIGTATHFILKKYKDGGVILDDGDEDLRARYQP